MRFCLAILLLSMSFLGACDVPVKSQVPSHVAEFTMSTRDYPTLLAALDATAESYALARFDAAPGLDELHGREVLFATYEATDKIEFRGVLTVTDVKAPGEVLLRVYGDGISDVASRARFVAEITEIVDRFGGKLTLNQVPAE